MLQSIRNNRHTNPLKCAISLDQKTKPSTTITDFEFTFLVLPQIQWISKDKNWPSSFFTFWSFRSALSDGWLDIFNRTLRLYFKLGWWDLFYLSLYVQYWFVCFALVCGEWSKVWSLGFLNVQRSFCGFYCRSLRLTPYLFLNSPRFVFQTGPSIIATLSNGWIRYLPNEMEVHPSLPSKAIRWTFWQHDRDHIVHLFIIIMCHVYASCPSLWCNNRQAIMRGLSFCRLYRF